MSQFLLKFLSNFLLPYFHFFSLLGIDVTQPKDQFCATETTISTHWSSTPMSCQKVWRHKWGQKLGCWLGTATRYKAPISTIQKYFGSLDFRERNRRKGERNPAVQNTFGRLWCVLGHDVSGILLYHLADQTINTTNFQKPKPAAFRVLAQRRLWSR